ncbi:MAG: hypothetical protein C4520_04705 [Candidatus Abyssobacteria bacterium SURF_5]|uniref:Cation:proton antiporter n=1 Tax=Abyssobacteria bacterium (strain SURF_5) TaxID=2093360 RepID=A0A3A4NUR2_ABYX5|nr:MAG: hypothetical protein C4520_04705 [Candidatus Abyssubacteria bacterium SURF_5]
MNVLQVVNLISLSLMALGLVFCFIRLLLGPTLPDRVVALDLMGVIAIGFIAAYSVAANNHVFVHVAVVMALIAFLTTVFFSYHIRRGI